MLLIKHWMQNLNENNQEKIECRSTKLARLRCYVWTDQPMESDVITFFYVHSFNKLTINHLQNFKIKFMLRNDMEVRELSAVSHTFIFISANSADFWNSILFSFFNDSRGWWSAKEILLQNRLLHIKVCNIRRFE